PSCSRSSWPTRGGPTTSSGAGSAVPTTTPPRPGPGRWRGTRGDTTPRRGVGAGHDSAPAAGGAGPPARVADRDRAGGGLLHGAGERSVGRLRDRPAAGRAAAVRRGHHLAD